MTALLTAHPYLADSLEHLADYAAHATHQELIQLLAVAEVLSAIEERANGNTAACVTDPGYVYARAFIGAYCSTTAHRASEVRILGDVANA